MILKVEKLSLGNDVPVLNKNVVLKIILLSSVSDPYHFDVDPDPRIRIRDDGSGSGL